MENINFTAALITICKSQTLLEIDCCVNLTKAVGFATITSADDTVCMIGTFKTTYFCRIAVFVFA